MFVCDEGPFQTNRQKQRAGTIWKEALGVERRYAKMLRMLARHVSDIIMGHDAETVHDVFRLGETLQQYEAAIGSWAKSVAARMVAEVNARDKLAWRKATNSMSREMAAVAHSEPTDTLMRDLLARQVALIKSIPGEAALKAQELARIHEITTSAVVEGQRPEYLVDKVREIATWTGNRPALIARTEVARTQTVLTEVRARRIGSTHYVWQTARDYSVRPAHKALEGTVHSWDDPPVAEYNKERTRHHPGCFPNCRCVAVPVIADRWAH